MEAVPLTPEDRAILALESETIAGHTCTVIVLGAGAPDAETLRAAIAGRIAATPQLACRLGGTADAPTWVPDKAFDAGRHVVAADIPAPVDSDGLRAVVARLFAERLDRARHREGARRRRNAQRRGPDRRRRRAAPLARARARSARERAGEGAGEPPSSRRSLDTLLHELARVSPRLERFVERVERSPRVFALNVSNVPGPREPVAVLGARVEAMHSLAEIAERHALRVAVVSLAGTLCFGFCADPAIVPDPQTIADGTEAEAAALIAAL